ncbi:hypothetical protein DEJ50_27430 [Streptomyces venezuelae]|uniref:Uncharacterized protein n=1 Tax=Streptomyces venezuelae TaxID=54571 RepID=A0A5P2DAB2_STRVZ|nr:hypothetical protein [Streptomyces venezuelae]QES51008.1 hypothetical protein DEJ50_27430 [Streptomyces venezuelae]
MLAETICSAVSAAGLGIAALTAYRRRFLAATRIAAYSLVPVGLVMTGVVAWLSGIVFKPSVWVGFGLLGLSWALFATTRAVERRRLGAGTETGAEAEGAAQGGKRLRGRKARSEAVAPGAAAPSLGTSGSGRPQRQAQQQAPAEDFSDIEAILKKHGI